MLQAKRTAIDTAAIKQRFDLRELAGRYTTLHRESKREMAGPCPKCGGDDRFHVTATSFMCRQCHDRWGDAIEFVRWVEGCSFQEAIAKLDGNFTNATPQATRKAIAKPQAQQTPEWMKKAKRIAEKAKRIADTAHDQLLSPPGQAGAEYLLSRGLELHTWQHFGLGYRDDAPLPGTWDSQAKQFIHPPQPAIVIPWHDETGQLTAIRYRFLQQHEYRDVDGRPRREKQCAAKDSQFAGQLYGWAGLVGGCQQWMTLIICEGELNALSIWQAQHEAALDVLSLGSESQRLTREMIIMARQYQRVIVWADRNDAAWQLQRAIPGAHGVKSPDGQDANDLLRVGKLGKHLAGIRYESAATDTVREGVLWDLYDAAKRQSTVDTGTWEAIEYLAQQLGKQISLLLM